MSRHGIFSPEVLPVLPPDQTLASDDLRYWDWFLTRVGHVADDEDDHVSVVSLCCWVFVSQVHWEEDVLCFCNSDSGGSLYSPET